MNPAPTAVSVTPEEYLAREEPAQEKSEYEDGAILPMPGGTPAHSEIKSNLYLMLGGVTLQQDFRIYNSDTRVRTPDKSRYYYPDISMVAGSPLFDVEQKTANLTNPCLVVEVLSASTRQRDEGAKFAGYRAIPSVQEYLLVEQERAQVTQWVRQPAGTWQRQDYSGLDAVVALASVPVSLPLRQVYRRVEVP